jgi:hypothetical protein
MTFDYEASFRLGHQYAELVTERLVAYGVRAELQPLEFAKDVADRQRFTRYEKDVIVDAGVLEVKSSSREFGDDPKKYPAPSLIVDTFSGFVNKERKPIAYCMVSQKTEAIVVVPVSSQIRWYTKELHDHQRGIVDTFLMAYRNELKSFVELVEWLKGKQIDRSQ